MRFVKVTIPAAVVFFGSMIPIYAQGDKKEESQPKPAQQRAPQAKPAAQQPQQHAQPAKPAATPPQQHAQQAKPAAKQPQQHAQQAKPAAKQPQQRAQQAKPAAPQSQQHAQQAKPAAKQPQQHAQQAKPAAKQPQQHAQQTKPATQQDAHPAPAQQRAQQAAAPQPQRTQQQAQSWQQQRGWDKQGGGWQPHTNFQQGRDQNWASDHRDWAQRGGYGGFYIPQATFGLYFGSAHFFHIGIMPVMYMGYPRFAYGGFSFMLLDPWPGSWQENWYASDDVYIDYSDGYYLHDRRYPGVSLAVTVAI